MVDEQADAREELTDSMVISRPEWSGTDKSRKNGNGSSCTPNTMGEMCCLGHYLKKLNLLDNCERAIAMPIDLESLTSVPTWLIDQTPGRVINNSQVARELANVNDNHHSEQAIKEATIAYVFEQYGVDVIFKG